MTWNRELDSMGRRAGETIKSGICWWQRKEGKKGLQNGEEEAG